MAAVADPAKTVGIVESKEEADSVASAATFDERLDGTWILDKTVSDSMDPFLAEVGVPWLVRKGITSFGATLKLTMSEDKTAIDFAMTTAMRTNENRIKPGKGMPWVRGDGTKMQADISITDGGKGYAMDLPKDEKIGKPSMAAALATDDTLQDILKLVPNDPKRDPIVIKRVFRRQK